MKNSTNTSLDGGWVPTCRLSNNASVPGTIFKSCIKALYQVSYALYQVSYALYQVTIIHHTDLLLYAGNDCLFM